ncbi:MAG: hypothetical protein MJE66_02850 [Proteobacteria bacterium]|nr:hypothetical protein [Pseudomonadota bacterium]
MTQMIRYGACAVLLIAAVAFVHPRVPITAIADRGEEFVPRPGVAKAAAMGFEAVLADYYWLQAVQVVGASRDDPSQHAPQLGRYIEVVTTLNPHVSHPYRFAAVWLTDSPESVRKANQLLRKANQYHPEDWRNYFYLAFNLFFYFGENEQAAEVLGPMLDLDGVPVYLRRLHARLAADGSNLEVAKSFLLELHRGAVDEKERVQYELALEEIETEERARFLDAAREEYKRRHSRDIRRPEDLMTGPGRVLRELPPEPHGWEWQLAPETGEIVSSYYRKRYQVHMSGWDAKRLDKWRKRASDRDGGQSL